MAPLTVLVKAEPSSEGSEPMAEVAADARELSDETPALAEDWMAEMAEERELWTEEATSLAERVLRDSTTELTDSTTEEISLGRAPEVEEDSCWARAAVAKAATTAKNFMFDGWFEVVVEDEELGRSEERRVGKECRN